MHKKYFKKAVSTLSNSVRLCTGIYFRTINLREHCSKGSCFNSVRFCPTFVLVITFMSICFDKILNSGSEEHKLSAEYRSARKFWKLNWILAKATASKGLSKCVRNFQAHDHPCGQYYWQLSASMKTGVKTFDGRLHNVLAHLCQDFWHTSVKIFDTPWSLSSSMAGKKPPILNW